MGLEDDFPPIPPLEDDESATSSKKWQPSFGDLVTLFALVGTIIMWFEAPGWRIGLPIVLLTIAAIVITAKRHQSHFLLRSFAGAAVIIFLLLVVSKPIWQSFRKDYPNAALTLADNA